MILHAYFTDGFFDWALFYLETFRYYNGLRYYVVFDTVGLTPEQVNQLCVIYPKLTVFNKELDLADFSRRANIATKRIARYKYECENEYVNPANKVWKLMTAGEDRVKCLRDLMSRYQGKEFYVLHTDIDVYFRGEVQPLINKISRYDIALRIKWKSNPIKTRMSIGLIGLRMNLKVFWFMEEWAKQIDKVPPAKRPIGYGQISCWEAYKATRHDKIIWGTLPKAYGNHGKTKSGAKLWSGNLHGVGKVEVLRRFRADFEAAKEKEGMV